MTSSTTRREDYCPICKQTTWHERDLCTQCRSTKTASSLTKPQYSLLTPEILKGMAEVMSHGARKYSKNGWKQCKDPDQYMDALFRHIEAFRSGELIDPDSKLPHLHHAACNVMMLDWFNQNTQQTKGGQNE